MKDATYPHVETLYALKKRGRGLVPSTICRRLAESVAKVYAAVVREGQLGRNQSAQTLRAQGWRAVKVIVQEV
jgi:hypothetical protein